MILRSHISHLLFAVLLALFLTGCTDSDKRPLAVNGVLDLSTWDFDRDGIVNLDGQWSFYHNKLLSPEDFRSVESPERTAYIALPSAWVDYEVEGKKLQAHGYASYRLLVKTNESHELKALRASKVLSAYKLWVNGQLVASSGTVGKSLDTETPKLSLVIAQFEPDDNTLDIILQVSNHNYRGGGVLTSISFGSAEKVRESQNQHWAFTIVILSGLLIMAGYHFLLYLLRRDDLSPLYLGFYCVCWAVNNLFSSPSGWLIEFFLPDVAWTVFYRVGITAYFLSNPVFIMFLHSLYPRECSVIAVRFYQWLGLVFCLLAVFLPVRFIVDAVPLYHFFSFGMIAYSIYCLIMARQRKRDDALVLLAGFMVLALAGANDMLHDSGIINTAYFLPFGLFLFIFFQSLVLSMRFSRAFTSVEKLSAELRDNNIALTRMDKLKDEFLANTSHELRTPLIGMIGIAESLQSSTGDTAMSAATHNSLNLIVGSGRRLANLVNDILDFSRLKHKDLVFDLQPQNLYALSDTVMTLAGPLAKEKSLQLINNIPKDLPAVQGNQNRLQQVLYNLIGNAIKYTDQGQVEISARRQGEQIIVCVSDTGIGIAPDYLEAIFEPFEQVDQSAYRHSGSSGLGLGLSRQLIELHGGRLSVESTPGLGSQFCFTLNCAKSEITDSQRIKPVSIWMVEQSQAASVHSRTIEKQLSASESVRRILVVDDDPVNCQVVFNHLTEEGMAVAIASSGEAALQRLEAGEKFDLILLDIMMPEIDGYEVCRRLRQRYTSAELPVLMLTARNQLQDLVQGLNAGANDYLPKPFAKEELLARVRAQLNVKRAHLTLVENQRLKQENLQRRQTEYDLRLTQHSLGAMLNSVPEPILAINESMELNFCNHAFEQLTGHSASTLLGRSKEIIFAGESKHQLQQWLAQLSKDDELECQCLQINYADHSQHEHMVQPRILELEEEQLLMLLVHPPAGFNGDVQTPVALSLIESLNQNRNRLHTLEEALNGLIPRLVTGHPEFIDDLHAVDSALAQLSHTLSPAGNVVDQRLSVVDVMNLTIDYWCECTQTSKAELARQSGLWKVYTNEDGWDRTQTLDRYLSLEELPKRPRWKQVIRTAEFVLANSHQDTPLRQQLDRALAQLRGILSGVGK